MNFELVIMLSNNNIMKYILIILFSCTVNGCYNITGKCPIFLPSCGRSSGCRSFCEENCDYYSPKWDNPDEKICLNITKSEPIHTIDTFCSAGCNNCHNLTQNINLNCPYNKYDDKTKYEFYFTNKWHNTDIYNCGKIYFPRIPINLINNIKKVSCKFTSYNQCQEKANPCEIRKLSS